MLLAARNEIGGDVLWKMLIERCVSESNPDALARLLYQTEEAMFLRSQELTAEEEELRQAAQRLLELKTEKLGWPDPLKFITESSESV